jgi:hypothetical protein
LFLGSRRTNVPADSFFLRAERQEIQAGLPKAQALVRTTPHLVYFCLVLAVIVPEANLADFILAPAM